MSINSYSSIHTLGHKALQALFTGPVVVEEKVDGSQFIFSRTADGQLLLRSKGKDQTHATDSLFEKGRAAVEALDLTPGLTYRGEYLEKPKHNVLFYSRIPANHVILFDIERGPGDHLSVAEKHAEAARLGLEVVPCLYEGTVDPGDVVGLVTGLLDRESVLGGQKIEGVVVKNYSQWGLDHKVLMGKWVSADFKEVHKKAWGESNPSGANFVDSLAAQYCTQARWQKAVQHLREDGVLQQAPQDIGPLMKEINTDLIRECKWEITDALWNHFSKQIVRMATRGFPEWYKQQLLEGVAA